MLFSKFYSISLLFGFLFGVCGQQVAVPNSAEPSAKWQATFTPNETIIHMESDEEVQLTLRTFETIQNDYYYVIKSQNPDIAISENLLIKESDFDPSSKTWLGNVTIRAIFLGKTEIVVERHLSSGMGNNSLVQVSKETLKLTIIRKERVIDHVFTGSIILLCSLIFINFGAALDVEVLKTLMVKPVGPSIGVCCQFILMPLLSYGLGYLIFPNSPELQLGLFFTGVSPSGGASNIWTVILNGNINLSVLMTTISNFAAFLVMPFWLFTLGAQIFARANLAVPYARIGSLSAGLIIPLLIGLAVQKSSPRLTRILVRLLKPISSCLLLFIVVFAIVVNYYLFKLFSWQILVAGFTLPFLGYLLGWLAALILKQSTCDAMTIAVETGIQNTGIAIFMLRKSLEQPDDDITTVIPVAVAIMTPLPLFGIYLYNRFSNRHITPGVPDHTTPLKNDD